MYSRKLYSPLRYPGGKARFSPFIAELMSLNNLKNGHYLEPFAGGAGVALDLLFSGHASHIHINDADPAIYSFWVAITQHHDEFVDLLLSTPITIDEWYKWRSILRDENTSSIVEKGFSTLFMNRTNRSGILKAGVIGGKSQNGKDKLDARFKKDVIHKRILKIAERAEDISVYCKDAYELIDGASSFLPVKSLIYLDPPYYVKGKGLYRNYYNHDDHLEISELLKRNSFEWPWVVSYDNVTEIKKMYSFSHSLQYGLNYTAQRQYIGNEIMFFSKGMDIPVSKLPNIKAS